MRKKVRFNWLSICGAISPAKRLVCGGKKAHDGPHQSMVMEYRGFRGRFEWSGDAQEKWVSIPEGQE